MCSIHICIRASSLIPDIPDVEHGFYTIALSVGFRANANGSMPYHA